MGRGKLATLSSDNAIVHGCDVLNKRGFSRTYVLSEHTLVNFDSIFHAFYMVVYNMLIIVLILEPCSLCAPQYLGGGGGGGTQGEFSQSVITLTIHYVFGVVETCLYEVKVQSIKNKNLLWHFSALHWTPFLGESVPMLYLIIKMHAQKLRSLPFHTSTAVQISNTRICKWRA